MARSSSLRALLLLGLGSGVAAACSGSDDTSRTSEPQAGSAGVAVAGSSQAGSSSSSGGTAGEATSMAGGDGEPSAAGQPASSGAGGAISVVPEGGSGGAGESTAGAAGACTAHCTTENAGQFCGPNQVTWICNSLDYDAELFNQACQDAATGAIRYCCPPEFAGECP